MSREWSLRIGGGIAGFLIGLIALGGTAHARVSTEIPGSILIFPKVINLGDSTETVIQLTNTRNGMTHARCFYVDGESVHGTPLWQVTDFEIWLTRQQPTEWLVSAGRRVDPTDDETGLDPGAIPPVPPGFTGELTCVEVDDSGVPVGGNSLKGEATVATIGEAGATTVSKYNAVAIPAVPPPPAPAQGESFGPDGSNTLLLDNVQYSGCPTGAHLNFVAAGAGDDVIDGLGNGPSTVDTTLTVVPCSQDFEHLQPTRLGLFFDGRDEFETRISTSTSITCWGEVNLADLGVFSAIVPIGPGFPSTFGYARIESTLPADGTPEGILAVANVLRIDGFSNAATAATNLHFIGNGDADTSVIRLSSE